jgi:hypothetical protein
MGLLSQSHFVKESPHMSWLILVDLMLFVDFVCKSLYSRTDDGMLSQIHLSLFSFIEFSFVIISIRLFGGSSGYRIVLMGM